jgi:trehalose 6-phosphate phosphatase
MDDPTGAFERLVAPIGALAERHHLTVEPGRHVIEVRSGDMHKGHALRAFVAEQEATGVIFGGDDLGDIEAFEAVRALRADGLPGLVVCSASTEQPDLVELADVVVDGPAGMVDLLGGFLLRR